VRQWNSASLDCRTTASSASGLFERIHSVTLSPSPARSLAFVAEKTSTASNLIVALLP
jgi:hypothetical protein